MQQSSVSRAIRQLEDELGVSLFERRSTGAHLTDAGRRLLCEARPALEQLDLARKAAAAAGRAEIGVVRVGILTSLAGGFLRELVRSYAVRHPKITIDIRDGGRDEHVGAIRRRKLDVAFVTGDRRIAECETAPLWEERVHVALPKGHKLASGRQLDWPDLRSECFIVSRFAPGPEVHDYIVRRAADYSTYPGVLYKAVVQETLMNLVGLGQGITLVSAAWVDVKLPDLVLRPLTDPADIVPFSAVWSPRNDNPALRRFISVAHTLAGRVRRGTSDWSPQALGLAPIKSGTSVNGQRQFDIAPKFGSPICKSRSAKPPEYQRGGRQIGHQEPDGGSHDLVPRSYTSGFFGLGHRGVCLNAESLPNPRAVLVHRPLRADQSRPIYSLAVTFVTNNHRAL